MPPSPDVPSVFNGVFGGDVLSGGPYDYEFDAVNTTSVPSGWSSVTQGVSVTYQERLGLGTILYPAQSTDPNYAMLVRSVPSSTPWTVTAKLSWSTSKNNYVRLGAIILRDGSTGKFYAFGFNSDSTITIQTVNGSTLGNVGSSRANAPDFTHGRAYAQLVVHSATNIDYNVSMDGSGWTPYQTGINPSGFMTFTQVGFGFSNSNNNAPSAMSCEWMRFR